MEALRNIILGGALFMIATAVLGTPPADSTIEQLADAPKFVDPEPIAEPKAKSPYAIAWESAQASGKLAVFIKMERCGPCEAALPLFTDLAASGGYAAVVLDTVKDDELVAEIGKSGIAPQIIVYERTNGEWFQRSVVGNKPNEIKRVMAGANATPGGLILSTPGVARPCSCESCPRDCALQSCTCDAQKSVCSNGSCGKQPSAGSGCASCGVSQGLPRRGFMRGRR